MLNTLESVWGDLLHRVGLGHVDIPEFSESSCSDWQFNGRRKSEDHLE